jgi:methyl-accepting chemotaxis protein
MRRIPSLSTRLIRMNMLVSGSVLLIAALAFFSYDLLSFRSNLINALDAEAQIVGDNSVSALTFNDPQSAATTLATLAHSPHVLSAALTNARDEVFVRYQAPGQSETELRPLQTHELDHAWPSWTHVLVAHRILFQGKSVGTVYVSASLSEIKHRAMQYALIAAVILLFCMVAALLISATGRQLIAEPIIQLADTALAVSRDQDYSVRATARADSSEIAVLVDSFNTMLTQIEERDAALNQARNRLEQRVEERTSELLGQPRA